jgi:predicted unusual protein kinase regulating ubiquinone biosynthesis (AarF/ABC1/UbiB family)
MSRLIKVVSAGLILSGFGVIAFNQQPYDRQQQITGFYRAARNSVRAARVIYGIRSDLNQLISTEVTSETYQKTLEEFRSKNAQRLKDLCLTNLGVYARMGQILGKMTGILPEAYLTEFQKLDAIVPEEISYEIIKTAVA